MGRLIDADALAELLKREAEHHEADGLLERSYGVLDAYMDVLQAPTAHPEPPKMGKWVEDVAYYAEDGCPCIITRCNQCGEPNPVSKFCPNCGARMEVDYGTAD